MQIASALLLIVGLLSAQPGAGESEAQGAPRLEVSVSTLQGDNFKAPLKRLTASDVFLEGPTGEVQLPVAQLLHIEFSVPKRKRTPPTKLAQVVLIDGSWINCSKFTSSSAKAKLESPLFGSVSLPLSAVACIRLVPFDSKVETAWRELRGREIRKDLLVLRKPGNVLDHLDGVVGAIDDRRINFLLDADELPVNRAKIFGIVYYRRRAEPGNTLCRADFVNDAQIHISSLDWNAGKLQARLTTGAVVPLPLEKLASLDFSFGKLLYLSDVDPREMRYTPFFDEEWFYLRNRTIDGEPLRVGKQTYTRGLCIHSKTLLRYRLGGEYRRFQAVMGIDDTFAATAGGADVRVVIRGDAKVLFDGEVRGVEKNQRTLAKPQELDLDVTGVRDLEILVDFVDDEFDIGISDWLDLADARVIK